MQLNPDAFAHHLDNFAEPFRYRKSFACPCKNQQTGTASPNCKACFGKGLLWNPPIDAMAAVASANVQLNWAKLGNYEAGDQVLSIPHTSALFQIAMFDRVTALTSSDERSVVLTHNGAVVERLHGSVGKVRRTFWLDANSKVVEGGIPKVADDGTLSWPTGGEPPSGKNYTVDYVRFVDYYCFGAFSGDRNKHNGLPLPRKMVMRRFELLGRTASGSAAVG